MRTLEYARKLGILRTQLKDNLIFDGLISEDTQLILDDDTNFMFEYRNDIWYTGMIEYAIVYYTTESNQTLAGYQLTDYQIQGERC